MEEGDVGPGLQRWLARVTPHLARVLRRRGSSTGDAVDDLVQESIVRWLRRADEVMPAGRAEVLLFAIARRVWLESLRSARRRPRSSGEDASLSGQGIELDAAFGTPAAGADDPGESVTAEELRTQVEDMLRRFLEPRQVEIFVRVWLEGCGWREAAHRCGLTAADGEAARRRFRRFLSAEEGRRSLRVLLEKFGIEPPNPRTPEPPNPNDPRSLNDHAETCWSRSLRGTGSGVVCSW